MKRLTTRIRTEKQFWLDLNRQMVRMGYAPKWEIAGQDVSKQKVWNRIDDYHNLGAPAFYGMTITVGRIGNHDLRFVLEMQDDLKIGLQFKEGFPYWTEEEIEQWGDLTIRLDHGSHWSFDTQGWFARQKLPVRLNFRESTNPAALDLEYYRDDSLVRLMIQEEINSKIFLARSACQTPKSNKVWNL